jgi:bla regulator protein blaR1
VPDGSLGANDSDAPSIFTAVEEQLGLRLVPARGPVDIIVVDSVQKATEN